MRFLDIWPLILHSAGLDSKWLSDYEDEGVGF